MATLQNKTILVVGGSSGIGFAVALAALQSLASLVIIASSNKSRVNSAVERLKAYNLPGNVRGEVLDALDSSQVKEFAENRVGAVDHVVWTSGDVPKSEGGGLPYAGAKTPEEGQGIFTVRFWGPLVFAKHAKFNPGGTLTVTLGVGAMADMLTTTYEYDIGLASIKPFPGNVMASSVTAALDGLTRGLAVDLAPVRVNVVTPGAIDTELFDKMFGDQREKVVTALNEKTLLKRSGDPTELAEAYLFLMKCGYITGQNIIVDGGAVLV